MTQELDPKAEPPQTPRQRQMRIGRGIASLAYNKLMAQLQKEDTGIPPHDLARMITAGAQLERDAYTGLPTDIDAATELLERILNESVAPEQLEA